ncbi:hypothetical protein XENOCAPTIV_012909 [Xenoophorus captivus]|uniref:Secreted protein n=1 Tax=Xenoophorus captivus TaxID=1517983 RepID=A0ABV0R034_9TELE
MPRSCITSLCALPAAHPLNTTSTTDRQTTREGGMGEAVTERQRKKQKVCDRGGRRCKWKCWGKMSSIADANLSSPSNNSRPSNGIIKMRSSNTTGSVWGT